MGTVKREFALIELGKSEGIVDGEDGAFVVFGTLVPTALKAAHKLRATISVSVVNARFAKLLDRETILPLVERTPFVTTVEEGTIQTGLGSTDLNLCNAERTKTHTVVRIGVRDRFIEHAERGELLTDLDRMSKAPAGQPAGHSRWGGGRS